MFSQFNFIISLSFKPIQKGQPVNPVLKKCYMVLDPLTRSVPGLMEGLFLITKVKYLSGKFDFHIDIVEEPACFQKK